MALRPTWAEIDLRGVKNNLVAIKSLVGPKVKVMSVVKANAYGHGAIEIAETLAEAGTDRLAVATLDEAVALREAGLRLPILVMGTNIPGEGVEAAIHYDIAQALCTEEFAQALSLAAKRLNKSAKVHLKIDTGMGRIGVRPEDAVGFMKKMDGLLGLKFEGVFSHFAVADELDKEYTSQQERYFQEALNALSQEGYVFSCQHLANSAGILDFPETHFDMVRPGCILYGCWPGPDSQKKITLHSTLTLKTRIVFLKTVSAGTAISYGLTYTAPSERVLATLPIGYADGYPRGLSNKGYVLVRGKRCPIVGRVCMDQCIIDVTDLPGVALGDEVVLIGKQGDDEISVADLAELCGTIDLEILCGITSRVPRVYIK
ncbi:MAG: alanine racemase [bacterium]|jgi:alanine racemase